MKVSLVNYNLLANDAVGRNLIAKARFFLARGDDVRIYVQEPPRGMPGDLARLCTAARLGEFLAPGPDETLRAARDRFLSSDLTVYDYPSWYPLVESIAGLGTGGVLFDYHGVTPPELWNHPGEAKALARSVMRLDLVHHADFALAHSPFTQADLASRVGYDPARIFVLPYSISPAEFRPGPRDLALARRHGLDGAPVILYVGRMAPNKRVDLLVRALPLVQRRVPGVKLLLVGAGRGAQAYEAVVAEARALARRLGVAQDVVLTGTVSSTADYYRLANIFVTASEHEGFCFPVVEAMASGLPVVAAEATALPWTLGDAGLMFQPGSVEGLADHVVAVLGDDRLRAELVSRGQARAAEFTPEKYETALESVVATALALPANARRSAWRLGDTQEATGPGGLAALALEADISLRDSVARSRRPLLGRLVERARYLLPSHAKEAYLDRLVERQILLYLNLVGELRTLRGEEGEAAPNRHNP